MAKNRVAPDRSQTKKKDHLFNKSNLNLKSKPKLRPSKKVSNAIFQSETVDTQRFLKPSRKGTDNFFMKTGLNEASATTPKQDRKHFDKEESVKPSESGSDSFFVKSSVCASRKALATYPAQKRNSTTSKNKNSTFLQQNRDLDSQIVDPKVVKKQFDKKKYRLQKYSKKYKLDQWEDKRKKAVLRGYYKAIREDEPKLDVKKIYEEHVDEESDDVNEENENNLNNSINEENTKSEKVANTKDLADEKFPTNSKEKKRKAFRKAHLEFQRIKEERASHKEEFLKKKAETEKKIGEYKKIKAEKFRKLNRKTKKGQPIMKDRIEMMLEKIQSNMT